MSRGFTLIELLIVLMIVALVVGTTAPAIARIGDEDPSIAAMRELTDLVNNARRTAVERGLATSLVFDTRSGRYWLGFDHASAEPLRTGTLPREIAAIIVGPPDRAGFVFDPEGRARGDSLLVRAAPGDVVIGVNRWTGAPYVR